VATGSTSVPVPIEREGSTTKQLKKFLSRNFYFCMSLVMAGFVVWGFSRTVDRKPAACQPAKTSPAVVSRRRFLSMGRAVHALCRPWLET
jgi:hypothetical protein